MFLIRTALALAIVGALLLAAAGPGTRLEIWEYGTGFLLMRIAFFTGLGVAALSGVLLLIRRTRVRAPVVLVLAAALGLATAWVPWSGVQKARALPFIHDISTDTRNPPEFVAVLPLRAGASNPPEYPGEEVAAQQREAYAEIESLELEMATADAFQKALEIAAAMGWEVVASVPEEGRIEATATTFWFGFKDDVVIRIEQSGSGSRLDIRSKSRVGQSDIGANAERIRRFLDLFDA